MLVELIADEENLNEDKIDMIYQHISSRATQILQGKKERNAYSLKGAMTMMEGVRLGGFDEDDEGAEFDVQETEFAFGPRTNKKHAHGQKKRSNSFKLGSRPREMKDQVRKTYRRNSFNAKGPLIIANEEGKDVLIEDNAPNAT